MELSIQTQWRVKINCVIMMEKRGYKIGEEADLIKKWNSKDSMFKEKISEDYLNVIYGDNPDNVNNLVALCLNESLNKESVIEIIDLAKDNECKKITLVINSIKHIGASGLDQLSSRLGQIQTILFTADEMLVDPTSHIYSPIYRKLSEQEKENLARQTNFKQLPLMRHSDIRELKLETKQQRSKLIHDPVAKYLDFQPSDVIEERGVNFQLNLIVPTYLLYRYVK